jgi:hypothetical protein
MRYPRKKDGKDCFIKMPFLLTAKIWIEVFLFDNCKIKQVNNTFYHNKETCQTVCDKHNWDCGFSSKKVEKIMKKYFYETSSKSKVKKSS